MDRAKFKHFWDSLTPYMLAGASIALFVFFIYFLFFVLMWGVAIGLVLYVIALIRQKWFPHSKRRRIIDHDAL